MDIEFVIHTDGNICDLNFEAITWYGFPQNWYHTMWYKYVILPWCLVVFTNILGDMVI